MIQRARRRRPEGSRRIRGESTRERLLEAAIELIAERGFASTTVGELCERAGTVVTSLYWHFDSKEGLLGAVIERVGEQWIHEIKERAVSVDGAPPRLERLLEGWHAILVEQPHLLRLLISLAVEQAGPRSAVTEALQRIRRRTISEIVSGLEESLGQRLPHLDLAAEVMVGLVQAALLARVVDPDGVDLDRLWAEFGRVIRLVIADRIAAAGDGPGSS